MHRAVLPADQADFKAPTAAEVCRHAGKHETCFLPVSHSKQIFIMPYIASKLELHGREPTSANALSLSADLIHGTVFLQQSTTLTVIQRLDELSSHICFIVLLLINFYFIFYTYIHYLLTIVMHSRPCLYDWALEHFFIIIIFIISMRLSILLSVTVYTYSQIVQCLEYT